MIQPLQENPNDHGNQLATRALRVVAQRWMLLDEGWNLEVLTAVQTQLDNFIVKSNLTLHKKERIDQLDVQEINSVIAYLVNTDASSLPGFPSVSFTDFSKACSN
jgi:hypothetical protein